MLFGTYLVRISVTKRRKNDTLYQANTSFISYEMYNDYFPQNLREKLHANAINIAVLNALYNTVTNLYDSLILSVHFPKWRIDFENMSQVLQKKYHSNPAKAHRQAKMLPSRLNEIGR